MIILQDEFKNHGYTDILLVDDTLEYGIDLNDLFDENQKPKELLGIFISKKRDDLFFLLDGDAVLKENDNKPMDTLCSVWDNRIRVFTIINGKSEAIRKLKYNIVQLIVYSGDTPDKSNEGNLMISRKIIIHGDMTIKTQIQIEDEEVIDLPFHMIPADVFMPDSKKTEKLMRLTACDDALLKYLKKNHHRVQKKSNTVVTDKSISETDYEKIKEWLNYDYS